MTRPSSPPSGQPQEGNSKEEEAIQRRGDNLGAASPDSAAVPASAQEATKVSYSVSQGLAPFLAAQNLSFAFTSYQSGRLYLVGRDPKGGIHVNERMFQQAMGLHADKNSLHLATLFQIVRMENVLKPEERVNQAFDACYVPRNIQITGHLHAHDVGLRPDGSVVFVNTKYSCLAEASQTHSFKPIWKPRFVSKLAPEDRCHLNGLAMQDGKPAYVTAISKSDTVDGWRDRRHEGGALIDVEKNKVVIDSLSMPHSPRMRDGKVWLLNSGTGELGFVDPKAKKPEFEAVAFCPGFARGLAFHGNFAFVGLSKPRYQRFEGLALDAKLREKDTDPWCGVQVIDLTSGDVVQWFRIDGVVSELYDVACIPGVATPMSVGFHGKEIIGFVTHEEL